ncbi:Osmotin-like protein OSM34 [Platanthera zijinensis]|uniref:Osmotin-like protein OSM34 n=1 Tax=Platanthera zijinensis TaxID=2320716 RepID=A0AAP0GF99_9ASPA
MKSSSSPLLILLALLPISYATTFHITNNCPYTIWPAATPGGGLALHSSQTWTLPISTSAATSGQIWARTNCSFNSAGRGTCLSGDCNGNLYCKSAASPPATIVKYSLNQYGANDFYSISLCDGFNVPVGVVPTSDCGAVRCAGHDIMRECPTELRAPGGCRSACDVFKTAEYCCNRVGKSCWPTKYSAFFKSLCPNCSTYPEDDPTSTNICSSGGDYKITFCP